MCVCVCVCARARVYLRAQRKNQIVFSLIDTCTARPIIIILFIYLINNLLTLFCIMLLLCGFFVCVGM